MAKIQELEKIHYIVKFETDLKVDGANKRSMDRFEE